MAMVYVVYDQDENGFSRPLSVWSSLAAAQAYVERSAAFFYTGIDAEDYGEYVWDETSDEIVGVGEGLWRYSDGLDWVTWWVQRLPVLETEDAR